MKVRTKKDLAEKLGANLDATEHVLNLIRGLWGGSNRPSELSEDEAVALLDKAFCPEDYVEEAQGIENIVGDVTVSDIAEADTATWGTGTPKPGDTLTPSKPTAEKPKPKKKSGKKST